MDRPFVNPLLGVPLVESPFCARLLAQSGMDAESRRIAAALHQDGFAVFDFPDPDLPARAAAIDAELGPRFDWSEWRPGANGTGSVRLMDEWRRCAAVRALAVNAEVLALLGRLYGRPAFPFQTLNFPVGTQQHYHSDAVHFSSWPERYMCGVWVALEDVDDANGPLYYYPGSHRLPIYTHEHTGSYAPGRQEHYEPLWEALVEQHGLTRTVFRARRGQAVIWAANLLHGGEPHRDGGRTRKSQVTHYYFENCLYYMPHHSDPMKGRIEFKEVVDVRTGRPVPQTYVREELPAAFVRACQPPPGYPRAYDGKPDMAVPPDFDPAEYLQANPDVRQSGIDPVFHYKYYGRFERRRLRP